MLYNTQQFYHYGTRVDQQHRRGLGLPVLNVPGFHTLHYSSIPGLLFMRVSCQEFPIKEIENSHLRALSSILGAVELFCSSFFTLKSSL